MANKWEPFDVNGSIFRPKGRLLYIEEPDFGCEGAQEKGPVYGSVVLEDKTGQRTVKIEESILFSGQMNDGMWYGMLGGTTVFVGRDRQTVYQPNEAELMWLAGL